MFATGGPKSQKPGHCRFTRPIPEALEAGRVDQQPVPCVGLQPYGQRDGRVIDPVGLPGNLRKDRKSTRLNSSHVKISYAVFCLKKKKIDVEEVCVEV